MYISGTAFPIYPNDMPQSGVLLRGDRSAAVDQAFQLFLGLGRHCSFIN